MLTESYLLQVYVGCSEYTAEAYLKAIESAI